MEVDYPVELGFALSELGLATCSAATLEIYGPEGCPANSLMGYGTALAELPIDGSIFQEKAYVKIVRTTEQSGHLALLIYAYGETPVSAELVFPAIVLPAVAPFGGLLNMSVPLIESLPGGPYVAIVRFQATIGPLHLRYRERVHGRIVDYEPKGIPLPTTCPPKGFPFAAKFKFLDGSYTAAQTTVPCPSSPRHKNPT